MGAEASTAAVGAEGAAASELQAQVAAAKHPSWENQTRGANAPCARECIAVMGTASAGASEAMFVLAGRGADAAYGDVAVYETSARCWSATAPRGAPPAARSGHTAVLVPGVGIIVQGGLSDETGFLADTALLLLCGDGGLEWTPLSIAGEAPCARDKHSSVLVPPASTDGPASGEAGAWRMVTFGGFGVLEGDDDDDDDDEEESDDAEEKETAPEAGRELSLADKLRLKAAKSTAAKAEKRARGPALKLGWFDDAHQLQFYGPGSWSRIAAAQPATERPAGRAAHGACWLGGVAGAAGAAAQGACMLVFGGRTCEGRANDTWLFDVDSRRWREPSCAGRPPCARSFHSVTRLDSPGGVAMAAVFGGLDASAKHLSDLYLLHSATLAWACVQTAPGPVPPPAGRGCAAVCATAGGALLVFGGSSGWDEQQGGATVFYDDFHRIGLSELLAAAVDAPPAAEGAAPAHQPKEGDTENQAAAVLKKAKLGGGSPGGEVPTAEEARGE